MRILAIGNSYSEDALRYLHGIAAADGYDIETSVLYIGGCSLERHVNNIRSGEAAYLLLQNGVSAERYVSVLAMLGEPWDLITIQQQSSQAANYATYQPWLDELVAFLRKNAPQTPIALHQTWAYRDQPENLAAYGFTSAADMFRRVERSYRQAADAIGAAGIFPGGRAFHELLLRQAPDFHRDFIHASLGFGRYTLGLAWYRYLTGADLFCNLYDTFDEPISPDEIQLARTAATVAADEMHAVYPLTLEKK